MALTADPVVSTPVIHVQRLVESERHPAGQDVGPEVVTPDPGSPEVVPDALETAARPRYRSWGRRYGYRLMITDVLTLLIASIVVHVVRFPVTVEGPVEQYLPYVAMTAILVAGWLCSLTWFEGRDGKITGYGSVEYKRIIHATFAIFGAAAVASYLFKLELPRSYLLVMMPVGLILLLLSRAVWRRWLHRQRDAGRYLSQVLAVGNVHTVTELLDDLRRLPHAGYKVIGVCLSQGSHAADAGRRVTEIGGVPVLGGLDNVAAVAKASAADTVAVTSTAELGPRRVRALSWELERSDAELVLAPALTNIAGRRIHTHPVAGLPLIHVDRPTYRGANRILKKSFDIVGSAALLLLFSPILIGFALAIKLTSEGPVFFAQDRVSINGKVFRMIKFRSMVVDAESRLENLRNAQRDAGNVVLFKMRDDPRVTPIGKFIRRYSIDELPQLFNVLSGQMSLVGPRPPLEAEVDVYGVEARRRLLVKPGLTGLWQVSGRSDLTWEDTVRLDSYYVENWSITGDIAIILKTAKAVLSSSGAY